MDAIRAEVPAADSAPVVVEIPESVAPGVSEREAPAISPAVAPEPREFSRKLAVAFIATAVGGLLVGGVTVWMWMSDSDLGDAKLRYPRAAVLEVTRPDRVLLETDPPHGSGMPGVGSATFADPVWQREIASHAAALQHRSILLRALKSPGVIGTAWHKGFKSTDLAAVSLARSLRVRAVPGTALIEVFVDTGSPQEQVILTTELVQVYLEHQRQRRTLSLLDRTQMLNTIRIKGESRMRDLEQEINELVRSVAAYRHRASAAAGTRATTRPADELLSEHQDMLLEEEKLARKRHEQHQLREQLRDVKERIEEVRAFTGSTGQGALNIVHMPSDK